MVAQLKFTTFEPRKAKNREDDQSYGSDADQRFFCGVGFSGSVAPIEMMPHMSRDHEPWATNDENHIMVPNPNEMISITAPVTGANTWVPKPQVVNERLDLQHGETQRHV
jgi:hypothetical protein